MRYSIILADSEAVELTLFHDTLSNKSTSGERIPDSLVPAKSGIHILVYVLVVDFFIRLEIYPLDSMSYRSTPQLSILWSPGPISYLRLCPL